MTTKEDRKAPPGIDRERALAALIFCAKQHPEQRLGQLIENVRLSVPIHASVRVTGLSHVRDEVLAAAFHAYARNGR